MAHTQGTRILAEAIRAGGARDYPRAVDLLEGLLATGEAPVEALLFLGRSHHALGQHEKAIASLRAFLRAGGDQGMGLFFLGRVYLASGRPSQASRTLRASLELEPGRATAWALLGAAQLKLRRSRLALECLEKATTLEPDDPRIFRGYLNALFLRACRLLRSGDPDMARQMLGFAIDNGLDGPGPRLWRAKALRELGRANEALADCEVAMATSPGDEGLRWLRAGLLLASGRQAEAMAEFRSLQAANPDLPGLPQDLASYGRIRASVAFKEGRWQEAVDEALAALKANPKDPALRALVAESCRALGQTEKSKAHWERALEADPLSPDFHLGYALTLFEAGDYAEAEARAARAGRLGADPAEVEYFSVLAASRLKEDPEALIPRLQAQVRARGADPRLMLALGEALYATGRPDLASPWFDKVLYLVPDHEVSLLYRISIAESLAEEVGPEPLRAAYEAYLGAYPDNQKLRREYTRILLDQARWEEAAAALEEGAAFEGDEASTRRLRAYALRKAGRHREAAIVYRELLRASPEDTDLLLSLAFCLEKDGKGDYALALLEKAPPATKKGAGPWMVLGILYERKGAKEKAVDAFRAATEAEPSNPRAWRDLGLLYRRMGLGQFAAGALERALALGATLEDAKAGPEGPALPATSRPAKGSPNAKRASRLEGDIPGPRRSPLGEGAPAPAAGSRKARGGGREPGPDSRH